MFTAVDKCILFSMISARGLCSREDATARVEEGREVDEDGCGTLGGGCKKLSYGYPAKQLAICGYTAKSFCDCRVP